MRVFFIEYRFPFVPAPRMRDCVADGCEISVGHKTNCLEEGGRTAEDCTVPNATVLTSHLI